MALFRWRTVLHYFHYFLYVAERSILYAANISPQWKDIGYQELIWAHSALIHAFLNPKYYTTFKKNLVALYDLIWKATQNIFKKKKQTAKPYIYQDLIFWISKSRKVKWFHVFVWFAEKLWKDAFHNVNSNLPLRNKLTQIWGQWGIGWIILSYMYTFVLFSFV